MSDSQVPSHLRPSYCPKCGVTIRSTDPSNRFVCGSVDPRHRGGHVVLVHPSASVSTVIVNHRNEFCVMQQESPYGPHYPNIFLFPGGNLEFGRSAEETAIAWAEREANILLHSRELEHLGSMYDASTGTVVLFLLVHVRSEQIGVFVPSRHRPHRHWRSKTAITKESLTSDIDWALFERAEKFIPNPS